MSIFTAESSNLLRSKEWIVLRFATAERDTISEPNAVSKQDSTKDKATGVHYTTEKAPYLIKSYFAKDRYLILVTNLRHVWYEEADAQAIALKAEKYGAAFETSDPDQLESLLKVIEGFLLKPQDNVVYRSDAISDAPSLNLTVTAKMKWATISWTFHATSIPATVMDVHQIDAPSVLYSHFILAMLIMASSSQRSLTKMKKLATDKDDEISEAVELLDNAGFNTNVRRRKTKKFDPAFLSNDLQDSLNSVLEGQLGLLSVFEDPNTASSVKEITEAIIPPDTGSSSISTEQASISTATFSSSSGTIPFTITFGSPSDPVLFRKKSSGSLPNMPGSSNEQASDAASPLVPESTLLQPVPTQTPSKSAERTESTKASNKRARSDDSPNIEELERRRVREEQRAKKREAQAKKPKRKLF